MVESYDLTISKNYTLVDDAFFRGLERHLELGEVTWLLGGPPCGTWSECRYRKTPGPPPGRSRTCLWGLPDLSPALSKSVQEGSQLAIRFHALCRAIDFGGGHYLLEHPKDRREDPYPSLFITDLSTSLKNDTNACDIHVDQCRYGCWTRKRTTLRGTVAGLYGRIGKVCNHPAGHPGRLGRRSDGTFSSKDLQTYPPAFCDFLAELCFQDYTAAARPNTSLARASSRVSLPSLARPALCFSFARARSAERRSLVAKGGKKENR